MQFNNNQGGPAENQDMGMVCSFSSFMEQMFTICRQSMLLRIVLMEIGCTQVEEYQEL